MMGGDARETRRSASEDVQRFIADQEHKHELSLEELRRVMQSIEQFFETFLADYGSRQGKHMETDLRAAVRHGQNVEAGGWRPGTYKSDFNKIDQEVKAVKGTLPTSTRYSQVGRFEGPLLNTFSTMAPHLKMKHYESNYNSSKYRRYDTPTEEMNNARGFQPLTQDNKPEYTRTYNSSPYTSRNGYPDRSEQAFGYPGSSMGYSKQDNKPEYTRYNSSEQVFGFSNGNSGNEYSQGGANHVDLERTMNELIENYKHLMTLLQTALQMDTGPTYRKGFSGIEKGKPMMLSQGVQRSDLTYSSRGF